MTKAKYLIGLLCALALAGLFTITKAPAQGNVPREPAATVIVEAKLRLIPNPNSPGNLMESGLGVRWIERSSHAPIITITPETSLAQVMADLQNEGFEMFIIQANMRIIFNRPAR